MQVLNIGDVANSARNSRNAVCRGNEDVDDYEGRALDEGVESCWSEMIILSTSIFNLPPQDPTLLTTSSPRRTSIAATRSMVANFYRKMFYLGFGFVSGRCAGRVWDPGRSYR